MAQERTAGCGVDGYVMVGVNHQTTPMALRDRLVLDDPALAALLVRLRARGVTEALALSTCDRVEIFGHGGDPRALRALLLAELCAVGPIEPAALAGQMVDLRGLAVVAHMFRITSALESQVLGEPHILGQVKAAHRIARDAGTVGSATEALMQAAYAIAKRVRSETRISEGPVSLAAVAAQIARDLHGDLGETCLLLLGTQEMGELIAEQLQMAGVGRLVVCAPRRPRAEAVAARLGASVGDHGALLDLLPNADIVVVGVGGGLLALGEEAMRRTLKRRRNRPVFIVDAGVPGNVEPSVQRLEAAFLYDLADLEAVAEEGRAARDQASREAHALVADAVAAFERHRAERAAVPAIAALRAHFEGERLRALAEAPDDAEKATRLLVGRLLHGPSEALRDLAAGSADKEFMTVRAEMLLRRLFDLPTSIAETGATDREDGSKG
ncbi:glutamyl-tRNA reductase [Rhodospirillum rubrum ATCC 11170]|nr:glutamyl-tRNA reductase [Rhodospirillum rubrum]ABC21553.1 glutamyl-tRNA reductase [Rhodospirillum rubrum ATCC 11170]MBK5953172.1 glutamyl-tRNA reductase [Rhodospirillum rubrum]HAQ01000.1 glutamyl-tRNA reductase [Rhodospirillum rubrum]HCF17808.1 glutamyl-tRNA reductase [Rhodospirillum rubrum]